MPTTYTPPKVAATTKLPPVLTPKVEGPPVNSQGMTPSQMGAYTEQLMKDRVIQDSYASPGKTVTGGQLGSVQSGSAGPQPITFQANTTTEASRKEAGVASALQTQNYGVPPAQQITPAEQQARYDRAIASQSGAIPPPPVQGAVYDPSTNSYRDPFTGYHYGGDIVNDKGQTVLGPTFTKDKTLELTQYMTPKSTSTVSTTGTPGVSGPPGSATTTAPAAGASSFSRVGGTEPGSTSDAVSYTSPDTSAIDAKINSLLGSVKTQAQIDADIAIAEKAIDEKYAQRKRDIEQRYANQKGSEFSNLAGVNVNPLSSGAASVGNRISMDLSSELQNEEAMKSAEKQQARAAAAGVQTSERNFLLEQLQKERTNIQNTAQQAYTNRRQNMQDTIASLNRAAQQAKENRITTNAERDDARANIKDMFTTFGSAAFEGVSETDLHALEKAAGYPSGTLSVQARTLKEQELAKKYAPKSQGSQFIPGTKFQMPGSYNKDTGVFTPVEGAAAEVENSGSGLKFFAGNKYQAPGFYSPDGKFTPIEVTPPPSTSLTEDDGYPKGFDSAAVDARQDLGNGLPWDEVVTRLQTRFPKVDKTTIETMLGTKQSWDKYVADKKASKDPFAALLNSPTPGNDSITPPPASTPASTDGTDLEFTDEELNDILGGLR